MNKIEFSTLLEQECLDTNDIFFSVTTAKGIITLFWYTIFAEKTNLEAFDELQDQIKWANMKLIYLEDKYSDFHLKTKPLTEHDAVHFDHEFATTKQAPVKKGFETNTQSMGGFVQFKLPKEL